MNKTQLRILKDALTSAQQRARSQGNGERMWLHTWIIPRLADVIGRAEGTVTEFQLRANHNLPLSGRVT